jgi:hypothetical protein
VLSFIEDQRVAARILAHLGLVALPPPPPPRPTTGRHAAHATHAASPKPFERVSATAVRTGVVPQPSSA